MTRLVTAAIVSMTVVQGVFASEEMWGEQVMKLKAVDAKRGQLFEEGNYAMFIHW